MSDLSPECAPKRASADRSEFMGSRPRQLPAVALQEIQSLFVEFADVLVDGSVGAALEDHHLAPTNASLKRISETGGGYDISPAECDLKSGL